MYEQQTTYLLGAGASWHYGYPTGEALLQELAQATDQLFGFLSDCKKLWGPHVPQIVLEGLQKPDDMQETHLKIDQLIEECMEFKDRLKCDGSISIDSFIGRNRRLEKICKLLIAWVIMRCQEIWELEKKQESKSKNRQRA